jgi:hypothetical protein
MALPSFATCFIFTKSISICRHCGKRISRFGKWQRAEVDLCAECRPPQMPSSDT